MRQKRSILVTALVVYMLCSFVLPAIPLSNGQSSCDSAHTIHVTLYPTPDTLNAMTSAARAAFQVQQLELDSAYPLPFPNGSLDWAGAFISSFNSNSNYTIWYYHVRPGLTWSDGTTANASDVIATYGPNFALNPTYDFAGLHTEVSSEYAANASTAVYVLNKPDALFPQKTSFMYFTPIYPASIVAKDGGGGALFDTPGVGPFVEQGYTPGSFQMVMVRNPHYSPQPALCQIDLNFVDNIGLTASYLEAGTTDLAPVAPSSVAQILSANPSLRVFNGPVLIYSGLQWNITTYPFNMTAFRQALAYGINQGQIVSEAFDGFGTTAYNGQGMIPPQNTAWYNPNQVSYSFNTTTAISLLASVGIKNGTDGHLQYPNGSGGVNGTDVTLNLYTDVDQTWDTIGASVIQQNLQALGFKVNENTLTATSLSAEFHANINNIAHNGMILYSTPGVFLSSPFLMTLPGWDTTWLPSFPPLNSQWEAPLSANSEYYSNLTAYSNTAVTSQQAVYVNNIQAINAKYLPMLTLGYNSYIWIGNTAHFTGWPTSSGYVMMEGSYWNRTAWTNLAPPSSASTSTSTSPGGGGTVTVTTSTGGGGGSATTDLLIAAIIVIIIVLGSVAYLASRRGKTPKT